MTLNNSITALLKPFRNITLIRNTRQAFGILGLAGCLLAPTGASAKKLAGEWDPMATISMQIALQQWTSPADLPELISDPLDDVQLQSLAEEASKQAQVKYLSKKWGQPPATVRKYVNLAWAEADKREGLEPELLIAIMQKESSLSPRVQSRYGAQGLMQVVRRWHRDKLHPSESLFDPAVNIRVGADVLEEYLEMAGGKLSAALAKYSGNARNYANAVLKESRKLARLAEQAAANAEASQG
ncbi:transglycosylase SLT domain-containing protein [Pollutimonas sp. H1-120]|uniref:transglycosylase SLT domain-containing protein n=1 Tax=Pollutimonas sp. H1-120 TaxID=3148824 RepID=UPI003B518287